VRRGRVNVLMVGERRASGTGGGRVSGVSANADGVRRGYLCCEDLEVGGFR